MFMTYQRITMRRKTCQSHIFSSKCQTICLMYLSIMKELPSQRADIHISVPYHPSITFVNQRNQYFPLLSGELVIGIFEQLKEETHSRDKRQSVISELLLRTMLMKAPIIFNPFLSTQYNFRGNSISRSLH